MRVHVISDIEGVAGIVRRGQVGGDLPLYQEARRLYTEEINAAVRGARAAGATEVVVMDCHGAGGDYDFNSLVAELLDPGCEFVIQNEWTEYTAFLEQGCDAALLVGMHAMALTADGVLSHTVSGQAWRSLKFNGTLVGETGINAALCGQWGCPVTLVTGDSAVCREAVELLGAGLTTVAVKEGIGRFSARSKTPVEARQLIEAAARESLQDLGAVKPYDPGRPCEIEIEFTSPDRLEEYRNRRDVEVLGPTTLVARGDDWWHAWSSFFF
ncbi:MAG: M55 family metallopeptidase [Actinobacteria bacterium]|nr:M55 family metallopeptidase [Actinomycetota bacterium]